jgi:hypothetical protein
LKPNATPSNEHSSKGKQKKTGRKGRMNEHVENEILILGLILGRERVES